MVRSIFVCLALVLNLSLGQLHESNDNDVEIIKPGTGLGKGTADGCTVMVKDDFSGFYPMIFTEQGEFWPGEEVETETETPAYNFEIPSGGSMIVSCAPNYLRSFSNQKRVKFTCESGQLTNELGMAKKWKDVTCELRPVEEIIVATVEHCEANHVGVEYGYVNPVTNRTYILGKACYNTDRGHTDFVTMKLAPAKNRISDFALREEDQQYFLRKQHPSGRYKIDLMKGWGEHTKTRADDTISVMANRYAFPQSVHLTTVKKLGWNYAFSQEGHTVWPTLQAELSAMVHKKGVAFDYYAGSHGVLKDNSEELYLGKDGRFPVPKYLWLFVREGVQGLAFVVYNKVDMSAPELTEFQAVCSSKCDQVQWLSNDFKTTQARYVLCCDVNDARATIGEMPLVTGITRTFLY